MSWGKEGGANSEWIPGGKTSGGTTEAVLVGSDKVIHNNDWSSFVSFFDDVEPIKKKRMIEYNFIYAIEHDEVQQYLLGEGKYFIPEREYCSRPLHDRVSTMVDIRSCLADKLIDEQRTYEIMDANLTKLLNNNRNSPEVLFNVSMYIWSFLLDFFEKKKLTTEWHISDELLLLVRAGYRRYVDEGEPCVVSEEQMKQCEMYKTTFKELLETNRRLFKERFGFEI